MYVVYGELQNDLIFFMYEYNGERKSYIAHFREL